ncbi:hypothetical protein HPP92_004493 [Vanilla planifolia]|uniref:GDSL esterase/lipase n=1 Tax=Vanilla planifolia TaxID=51239 RepID=A0A835SA81_VANPL|nr:hypothetical protein HPP92_004493 [Vanilla planifolia]
MALLAVLLPSILSVLAAAQGISMFVFGDSLVDDGNNNLLDSIAKANYYPYGIDFSQGATGRFSDGKTTIDDVLCDLLGIPYLPPYTAPGLNGTQLLGGVNYASAAAGILEETGQHLGERFPVNQQVLNFESNLSQLRALLGEDIRGYLARSIAIMVLGSNDYINNYLLPSLYSSSEEYTPEEFANLLINSYRRQILALHSLGLRKFLLAGIGPLGCTPNQRFWGEAQPDQCIDQVNAIVGLFNRGLRSEVEQLNINHSGAIFSYGNTYAAIDDVLNNPANYGFTVVEKACCGIDLGSQAQITCLPFTSPCENRTEYVFWDSFHPTTAVGSIIAQRAYSGPPSDCYPINVQQMVQI